MRERWPADATKLVAALQAPAPTPADLHFRFKPRALFGEPGFRRGVELARLGLTTEARREFAALGIKPPDKGTRPDTAEAEELLWLVTVLYDRAGEHSASHWIPRKTLTDYERQWPVGPNRKKWLLSYPRGYADLIIDHAIRNGQPPALEFAIVREESAFDPLMESVANAVGLTQLTQAPAKRFAQGLPFTREALRDPVINVTIGAREFGALWKLFDHTAPLAIAGYNAGENAVKRWLREAPAGQSLDEWVESIPYDETRGYTKRVLASWFAYHWLYPAPDGDGDSGSPVPPLPLTLPR
jgi:soluble lytic murein transglycosylase